jgi:Lipocalin-like domain
MKKITTLLTLLTFLLIGLYSCKKADAVIIDPTANYKNLIVGTWNWQYYLETGIKKYDDSCSMLNRYVFGSDLKYSYSKYSTDTAGVCTSDGISLGSYTLSKYTLTMIPIDTSMPQNVLTIDSISTTVLRLRQLGSVLYLGK